MPFLVARALPRMACLNEFSGVALSLSTLSHPTIFHGFIIAHKTGRLVQPIQGRSLFNVVGQETCELTGSVTVFLLHCPTFSVSDYMCLLEGTCFIKKYFLRPVSQDGYIRTSVS